MNKLPKSAGFFVYCRETGRILVISRKEDDTKFGCIGGKVEPIDVQEAEKIGYPTSDYLITLNAAIREGMEEAGVDFPKYGIRSVGFTDVCSGETSYLTTTYLVQVDKEEEIDSIVPEDGLIVKWMTIEHYLECTPFKKYDIKMIDYFLLGN